MAKHLSKILLAVTILIGFISCSKDEMPKKGEITGITEDVEVISASPVDSISLVDHYESLIKELSSSNDEEDQDYISDLQKELASLKTYIVDTLYKQAGINSGEDGSASGNAFFGYKYTTIRYKSIDENNNPITLSALVVWPHNYVLGLITNPDADGLVIGCHVTITDNSERPSNYKNISFKTDVGMLALAAKSRGALGGWSAAFENLVVIPDYQGYGASSDRIHPYLYQDLTARQVIDGVQAGIKYYTKDHKFEKNWKSISMGYSQGGSVAMAVHKYIEKNNLTQKFNFVGSLCGDGPYDPMATLKRYINEDRIYMPVAVGLILKGMVDANPYIRGKYQANDFFTQEFLDTGILEMIEKKDKSTDGVQKALLEFSSSYNESEGKFVMYRKTSGKQFLPYTKESKDANKWESGEGSAFAKATDVFRPELIDWINGVNDPKYAEKMDDFAKAMDMNNLTNGQWTPQQWLVAIHSEQDEVVPIDNYNSAKEVFLNKSSFFGYPYGGDQKNKHVPFGKVFYISYSETCSANLFKNFYSEKGSGEYRVMDPGFWGGLV